MYHTIFRGVSKVPNTVANSDSVDLYNTTANGKENLAASMSENFNSHAGSISFIDPQVAPGSYYVKRMSGAAASGVSHQF